MRKPLSTFAGLAIGLVTRLAASPLLPVFLSDNHADTFSWMVRSIDLDQPHLLVLVDAHADSTMAERSDEIRETLRRVSSTGERIQRADSYLQTGRIQSYNWIEPLMPRPIERVWWFPDPGDDRTTSHGEKLAAARSFIDGRLEVEPRDSGRFADRFTIHSGADLTKVASSPMPVLLAIDLDAFSGMSTGDRALRFGRLWQSAMRWPNLVGVALAVSRPWLKDDAEAHSLVQLALDTVSRTRGAVAEIDITPESRPDDSHQAGLLQTRDGAVPRWDFKKSPGSVRALVSRMPGWRVINRNGGGLPQPPKSPTLVPDASVQGMDGVWRIPTGLKPAIRIRQPHGFETTGRTRWHRLLPAHAAVDLLPHTGLGKDFATTSARWVHEALEPLAESGDLMLDGSRWTLEKPGRVRIIAEVETRDGDWVSTPPMEVRFIIGEGFHAALSECIGMPYVFGIAGVVDGDLDGVDSGWGSDCANLLVHAWRRNGNPLVWGDPGRLRSQLGTLADNLTIRDEPPITHEQLKRGIAIDFGRHVAALWEDLGKPGILDGADLCFHHLGGFPEIVTLASLCKDRPHFSLRTPMASPHCCTVRLAGDLVLASDCMQQTAGFAKGDADLFLANLEGIPSLRDPGSKPRHDFRFPSGRLAFLRKSGVDCVSLANNHAADAGPNGLLEGISELQSRNIPHVGAGKNRNEACNPWLTICRGVRIGVFGVCLVDALPAGLDTAGVARLPDHAGLLARKLQQARAENDHVIVMLHAGDEYRDEVNESQRHWTRWLIREGATVVAGSHPHVVQPEETFAGARVFHSLGNAVYPASLKGLDSGRTAEIGLLPRGATEP